MKKIGITPCFFYPNSDRGAYSKKSLSYVENDMVSYVAQKGLMPILIPDLKETELKNFIGELDGIIFQGGDDVCPTSYHEEMIENGRWPGDIYRDKFEFKIMDFALERKLPILGICRGFQLINVYYGGTLYQDIKTQTNGPIIHRDGILYDEISHEVTFTKDGILEKLYGTTNPFTVNSVHHQGVKKLGTNLVVDAICEQDNLIEAFYLRNIDQQFVYCVQWHPEFSHTLEKKVISPWPILEFFLEAGNNRKEEFI